MREDTDEVEYQSKKRINGFFLSGQNVRLAHNWLCSKNPHGYY